jgi:DNA primase
MIADDERVIIRLAGILGDLKPSGAYWRAYCPIHGSDHQRSLAIRREGPFAGFGNCHNLDCLAEVLVEDFNPEAAQRLRRQQQAPLTAEKLLRQIYRTPHQVTETERKQEEWRRQELANLSALDQRMRDALALSQKAQAYLASRSIPLDLAQHEGVGYIPPQAMRLSELRRLYKWADRLIFPLASPIGAGYAGRSLHLWQPGMDENEHKALLDRLTEEEEAAHEQDRRQPVLHRRWEKTYPAGWYGWQEAPPEPYLVLVEGPFDRLALLAADRSVKSGEVVALVGSKDSRADWISPQVRAVLLALDGDAPGRASAARLRDMLYTAGIQTETCTSPEDDQGKDWSERWRRDPEEGVWPVFEAVMKLAGRL